MGKQKSKAASSRQPTTITMSGFEGTRQSSPPSPTQHRQQYQPPAQQQQQQPVYRPSYPQQQYPPPHQYQRPQYPPQQQQQQQPQQQQQQGQQYQPPYLQQQYQPPPPQQYPPQQYPAQHPQSQQEEYAHHQQQHQDSSPPQSPQEELSSPIEQPKRTGSFKGLPPIRRGSTFGISLREATSSGMIDDSDIPPVPSLSPSADIPDHALLGSDVAAPLENGTNISIGQNSEVTLVGADSSRTRRTSLGLKDSNRDSQHNSHRSSSASHSLQIDTVAANAGNEIPEVPQVPPQFGQQPQFVAPPPQFAAAPSGWAMQTSNLQAPLVPVARKRAGTNSNSSPQQPANFGLEKETGAEQNDPSQTFGNPSGFAKDTGMSAATPVSPIQSTYRPSGHPPLQSPTRATRPSNPPSAAARHPDLFPNVPQSPTTRGRAGSTGQTSTHSDQQVSRFSMDSNDRQQDRPPQAWTGAIKNNSPKMDDDGRSRMSLLKNISNRINQLPQRDSRGLVPDHHHRPHSTEPHMHDDDDDDSEISLENPPQPRRKRTSVLTGTAVGNRSSMDDMRFPRPGSPTNSHKAPSTNSEKKKSLFGKITQSGRFKSGLAKSTTLGSVNESTATSSVNSNGSTLKSKYFAGGFSGLAGKLKRQGKDNSQQPSRPFHGQPLTVVGSTDNLPSEPSSPNGGGFYGRPRTGSAAPAPQPPPSIPEHEQESRPRRGSMSGMFSSLRGKASAQLKPDEDGVNGRAETPPLSAPLRPPPLFARSNSPTGPMDPDNEAMYQNGPRMGGRPMSQGQQQVRPSPLAQAQSQSRLDLETSSVESDEEDHLVGHRASTSPSLTTARTSGPSQRGSGPAAPKHDHSEPSDYASRPIGSAGEAQDLNHQGYKGPFATNGIPPNEGAFGPARRQPTPHSGALPAFLASDAKPAVGLRRPSEDRANQGILARKPVPNPVPIPGPASAAVTAPRPATPDSVSEPPVSAAGVSGWGSTTDVPLPEDKTLQQVKPLPGAPGSPPPQGIVSEPSIHSIGPASRRYPSPQPSAMSVISSMQNQGDPAGRDSISAARADPQKSGWKALRERVSSGLTQPKMEKEKSSGGGKLFSVLKRGSKAPGPIRGIEEENIGQQNGPLRSPLNPEQQLPGSGHRPMYTVVARPGQIPTGAVPVNQQGQGPAPSHWDNPQALGALGRGQPTNGDGRPQQPSRMQQMLTKAPEPQYGSVPIPKGYTAVHGEGGVVPTMYRVGPQPHPSYPQGQQQHPGQPYPYGAQQQAYYGQSPQGPMPHSPLPPGSQQGPQPDAQHEPYTMVRNGSVAESHAPSIVSVPPGAQASREALNPEEDRNPDAMRGARPPQIVQHPDRSHEINVAGVLPTPASQDEPNILRGNSIASEGARSNESGVMGIYSPKDRSVDRELHKPNALHLKVSNHNLTSSEVSRENSSASSEGHGQERVAQRVEVIKVVSPTNSISNDTIKGGPGSISGSSRARSIDVPNASTRSRAGSKLAAESSQDTKRVTARDSNDDLYDATPKIKQGNGKPATSGPETPSKPKVAAKSPAERKPKAASPVPLAKAGPPMAQPKAASPAPQAKTAPPIAQPKAVSPAAQVKAVSAIQAKPASPVAQAKAASPVAQAKAASPVTQVKAASPVAQAKAASSVSQAKAAASPVTQTKAAAPATQPKSSAHESGEASRGFTVELADTADARMRTLRLNEQEEKIFYEPEGEPPKMTATSYPGQEWNPYGEPEFWNDE